MKVADSFATLIVLQKKKKRQRSELRSVCKSQPSAYDNLLTVVSRWLWWADFLRTQGVLLKECLHNVGGGALENMYPVEQAVGGYGLDGSEAVRCKVAVCHRAVVKTGGPPESITEATVTAARA